MLLKYFSFIFLLYATGCLGSQENRSFYEDNQQRVEHQQMQHRSARGAVHQGLKPAQQQERRDSSGDSEFTTVYPTTTSSKPTVRTIHTKVRVAEQQINIINGQDVQGRKHFFRKDYTYLPETRSFYKIHTIHRTWYDAKKQCALEGASLFYAEDENEANQVLEFWKRTQPFSWVYVGISDLLAKGDFETIDGRPILDVYSKWGPGEPNDAGGTEDCVVLHRDGNLNDDNCNKKYPFICKKSLETLEWNNDCNMPYNDYIYNAEIGHCYKFHRDGKSWTEAVAMCNTEQSYLAIINNQAEADYLVQLTEKANKDQVTGLTLTGVVYLGFHNKYGDGWTTIKSVPLKDSGYAVWGNQQPNCGGENKECGSMLYNGKLNTVACHNKCFYICEHDVVVTI